MREVNESVAGAMAAKMDAEIKGVLDERCPGWTMIDVKHRCAIVSDGFRETLYLDQKPILEMYPIELSQEKTETGWTMRATRFFRRLPAQPNE